MSETLKENITLDFPSIMAIESYIEALQEGFQSGIQEKKSDDEIEEIKKDPEIYLKKLNEQSGTIMLANGDIVQKVPSETLWLCDGKIFIGEVSFRHELNENLKQHGGHVGYGIRPSMRGQGLATFALELTRVRAGRMGLEKLLVTCSPENPASKKVIINNGGKYIDTQSNPFGYGPTERYWVMTST